MGKKEVNQTQSVKNSIIEWVKVFGLAIVLAFVITLFIKPTLVSGDSMLPTLHENDYLIINKIGYKIGEPKNGDVIVFKSDLEKNDGTTKDLVKRIIGVAGDKVVIKDGKVYLNDKLLDETYLSEGVDHILALRGDFPRGENSTGGDFNYATDLVKFIRKEFGDKFEIAVAGSPEGHIACRSLDADISVLKMKQDNGADYIMTQLCWDMEQFARWQDKIRKAGVTMPIDVGIMPILDEAATINMALSRNGCVMDRELSRLISKYWIFPNPFDKAPFDDALEQKKEDFKKAGIEYTIKQIDKYRALGVEGIHLYALNKWKDVSEIIKESGMRTLV